MSLQAGKDKDGSEQVFLGELLAKSKAGDAKAGIELRKLLLEEAKTAAQKSYSPYSQFPVGAALLSTDGAVIRGCNVENASYGGTICAERTALVKAVSEGHTCFEMIAVACLKLKDAWPCGLCRQFICEFGPEIEVLSEGTQGELLSMRISELLPRHFGPRALGK